MRGRRRGNFAIITGLALTALIGMGALAVDTAYALFVRQQAINVADAAALAGATGLDGTEDGMQLAIERAQAIAAVNQAAGEPVLLDGNDIEFGFWDDEAREFVPSDDPEEIDALAVRVRTPTQGLLGEAAFGRSIQHVSGRAVGLSEEGRADTVECFLPIAIPSCLLEQGGGPEAAQEIDMVLNPPGADNVGWARPDGNPNASWLRDQIRDCEYSGEIEIGDTVQLNNGVVNSAMAELADAIEDSDTAWDAEPWGAMPAQERRSAVSSGLYGNTWEAPGPRLRGRLLLRRHRQVERVRRAHGLRVGRGLGRGHVRAGVRQDHQGPRRHDPHPQGGQGLRRPELGRVLGRRRAPRALRRPRTGIRSRRGARAGPRRRRPAGPGRASARSPR